MFATTGRFKSVDSKKIDKNNDKNINIPTSVPISIDKVKNLIDQESIKLNDTIDQESNKLHETIKQESVKAHDDLNQAIKQIGIDTTKLSIENTAMKSKIANNKQKSIDNLNKTISNSNKIFKNANDISNNSSNISNNSSNISNNSSNISNNSSKILALENAKDNNNKSKIDIKITEMQTVITDLQNEIKTLKASNLALTQLTMSNVNEIGLLKK